MLFEFNLNITTWYLTSFASTNTILNIRPRPKILLIDNNKILYYVNIHFSCEDFYKKNGKCVGKLIKRINFKIKIIHYISQTNIVIQ